jgi:hypothetical protein
MHAAAIIIVIWGGFWEWVCLSSGAVLWSIVNPVIALLIYAQTRRMGVVPQRSRLILRYLLFRRSIPWDRVGCFALEPLRGGRALRLYTTDDHVLHVPAGQFAGSQAEESWLRSHRLVWQGGSSADALGCLNALVDEHRR